MRAVITGASARVGRACALELARNGFDLVITCECDERGLSETAALCLHAAREAGHTIGIEQLKVDFTDAAQLEALGAHLASIELDALVHNASVYFESDISCVDAAAAGRAMAVNAIAPLILTSRCAASLQRSVLPGGAAVICMCDIHAMGRPRRRFSAYSMSKAALGEMVRSLALDLAPRVRVMGIAPGVVAWNEIESQADREAYTRRIPLGRAGTPEDVAKAMRWLILEAHYFTGQVLVLDGGRSLQ